MDELARKVEAILFATDHPLKLAEVSEIVKAEKQDVAYAVGALIDEYDMRDHSIEVRSGKDGYILQIRPDYHALVRRLIPSELTGGPLRTLSLIAARQPVLQTDVIEARGAGAYDHIRQLIELKYVQREPDGRTYQLRTTHRFARQFNMSDDPEEIRKALQSFPGLPAKSILGPGEAAEFAALQEAEAEAAEATAQATEAVEASAPVEAAVELPDPPEDADRERS